AAGCFESGSRKSDENFRQRRGRQRRLLPRFDDDGVIRGKLSARLSMIDAAARIPGDQGRNDAVRFFDGEINLMPENRRQRGAARASSNLGVIRLPSGFPEPIATLVTLHARRETARSASAAVWRGTFPITSSGWIDDGDRFAIAVHCVYSC